jgi:hypothetical protein
MNNQDNGINIITLFKGIFGSVIFIYLGYLLSGCLGYVNADDYSFSDAFFTVLQNPFGSYFNEYSPITMILGFILFEGVFFYLILRKRSNQEYDKSKMFEPDIMDVASRAGLDNPQEQEAAALKDRNMFSDMFVNTNAGSNAYSGNVNGVGNDAYNYVAQMGNGYVPPQTASFVNGAINTQVNQNYQQTGGQQYGGYVQPQPQTYAGQQDIGSSMSGTGMAVDVPVSFNSEITDDLIIDGFGIDQIRAMLPMQKYMKDVSASALSKLFKPGMSAEDITAYISMFYG